MKINDTLRNAPQSALVRVYSAEDKAYVCSATIALTPELVAWIKSTPADTQWLELRANLFNSKEDAASVYDGKAKPSKIGKEKIEYVG